MANLKCVSINQPSDWRLFFLSLFGFIFHVYTFIFIFSPFFSFLFGSSISFRRIIVSIRGSFSLFTGIKGGGD